MQLILRENFYPPKKDEKYYQYNLIKKLRNEGHVCDREVRTPVGRIDILINEFLIGIKCIQSWKNAIGQLIAYSFYYPSKKLVLALTTRPCKRHKNI